MAMLQRNQLVWLSGSAWSAVRAAAWDAQAAEILRHWEAADLPLVVARQRAEVLDDRVCLGLPAPSRWGRRRLALDVRADEVCRTGSFPALAEVFSRWQGAAPQAATPLCAALAQPAPALPLQVYGSFGWQALTGLDYVHAASDLDVLIGVSSLPEAVQAARVLAHWDTPWRVDGELMLPAGHGIAWRELLQASQGAVAHVLVKHRKCASLMAWDGLHAALGLAELPVHQGTAVLA